MEVWLTIGNDAGDLCDLERAIQLDPHFALALAQLSGPSSRWLGRSRPTSAWQRVHDSACPSRGS